MATTVGHSICGTVFISAVSWEEESDKIVLLNLGLRDGDGGVLGHGRHSQGYPGPGPYKSIMTQDVAKVPVCDVS